MYSALTYSKPLAGILAMSSWLPMHNVLMEVRYCKILCELPFPFPCTDNARGK